MLKGRVAIITGAGRGIGAATARAFAGAGCRVALVSRTRTELEAVAREIEQRQGKGSSLFEAMDVSDEPAVARFFEKVSANLGAPDILVNNAAIFTKTEVENLSSADWDRVMAVNVRGPFL